MKRSTDHILTTHAGSLSRPADLAQRSMRLDSGEEWQTFKAELRPAIAALVKQQNAVGIDIVSDGELAKGPPNCSQRRRLGGVTQRPLNEVEAAAMREQTNERREFADFYTTGQGG